MLNVHVWVDYDLQYAIENNIREYLYDGTYILPRHARHVKLLYFSVYSVARQM